jgi:hypothetical protein
MPNASFQLNGQEVFSEASGVVSVGAGFPALGNAAVGTVSESSGTPTGAVLEFGSNANGEYTKFADGTLICSRYNLAPNTVYSFPHAFATGTTPSVVTEFNNVNSSTATPYSYQSVRNVTNTQYASSYVSGSGYRNMIAHGRWY